MWECNFYFNQGDAVAELWKHWIRDGEVAGFNPISDSSILSTFSWVSGYRVHCLILRAKQRARFSSCATDLLTLKNPRQRFFFFLVLATVCRNSAYGRDSRRGAAWLRRRWLSGRKRPADKQIKNPRVSGVPHPLSAIAVRQRDKTYSCYGNRQTLTSPSDIVLRLMRIAEARYLSALLWGPMIHKHTGRWMWQGSAPVVSWNWGKYLIIPNWFEPCQCCCCLCYPGEYPRLGTLISYNWAQVLEACDCLKILSIYFHLCVDATGVVCHQLCLLGTDLHTVRCRGFVQTLN